MLLDSVLSENAVFAGSYNDSSVTDALTESLVNVESAYGEMMVEQAKAEFRQYVNEGTIEPLSEGVMDSIKNFFKKLWSMIKKYWNKLKNWITGLTKTAHEYFKVNYEKISNGMKGVTRFYGYYGLVNFNTIEKIGGNIKNAVHEYISNSNDRAFNVNAYASGSEGRSISDKAASAKKIITTGSGSGANDADKKAANDEVDKYKKQFRKAILSGIETDDGGFASAIKNYIRGGEKETDIKSEYGDDASKLKIVLDSETSVKQLALAFKMQEANTKDLENLAYKYQHQNNDNDNSGKLANLCTSMAKTLTTACNTAESMIAEVVKQADRMQRAAVKGNSDDERKEESFDMTIDDAKAYLESIGLA